MKKILVFLSEKGDDGESFDREIGSMIPSCAECAECDEVVMINSFNEMTYLLKKTDKANISVKTIDYLRSLRYTSDDKGSKGDKLEVF